MFVNGVNKFMDLFCHKYGILDRYNSDHFNPKPYDGSGLDI